MLWEGLSPLVGHNGLVVGNEPFPIFRPHLRIKRKTIVFLGNFQSFFERAVVEAKNNVRIHLNEAAIAVPGTTLVSRCGSKALNRLIVKAKIKDSAIGRAACRERVCQYV